MQTLNLRLTRDNLSRPWGFRLQGGFDSGSSLSVQRVFSGSPAEGILMKGDIIRHIENSDVDSISNKDVQDIIRSSGRQLNLIIERDSNAIYDDDSSHTDNSAARPEEEEHTQPKVSVKAARQKFQNTENRAPMPFGQFGTQFGHKDHSKSNVMSTSNISSEFDESIPTGLRLEMENSFQHDETPTPRNQSLSHDVDEDNQDYNFMTLPVSERKKLFGKQDEHLVGQSGYATGPRSRSYSFRPNRSNMPAHYQASKSMTRNNRQPGQQYGWGPNREKLLSARNVSGNLSAAPISPNQPRRFFGEDNQQKDRRFSTSATIPRSRTHTQSTSFYDYQPPGHSHKTAPSTPLVTGNYRQVFRVGDNRNRMSVEPNVIRIQQQPANQQPRQTGSLFVKTYNTDYNATPLSPYGNFKPAYPAYTNRNESSNAGVFRVTGLHDHSTYSEYRAVDSLSIRSEPHLRPSGYETVPIMRHEREVTPCVQSTTRSANLQMGAPRTRVVASPASPSFYLNRSPEQALSNQGFRPSPWQNQHQQPMTIAKMTLTQPRSSRPQKTINIRQPNQQRSKPTTQRYSQPEPQHTNYQDNHAADEDLTEQVNWMKKHRNSLAGRSDF